MEQLEPQFITSNVLLVTALHLVGVPWADPTSPCVNLYDEAILRERKCPNAKEAVRRKIPGRVAFSFKRTPELGAYLGAWDAQQEVIKKQEAGDLNDARTTFESMDPQEAVRLACQVLKNLQSIKGMWQHAPAMVSNGGKIISVNASEELRRKMGL